MYRWLLRALELEIISGFDYQPCTFELTPSVKYTVGKKTRTLFREHCYSPDFLIYLKPEYSELYSEFKVVSDGKIYIDVKGVFNLTARSFSIDQKLVYQKYGYYVYKLIPKDFMRKFGILDDFRFTRKTKKPSRVFDGYRTIEEVFGKIK